MRRLSIARSVRLALLGLSILLATLAGVGIASLYSARQRYENRLAAAFALEADAAKLLAASVVEEATLRTAHGAGATREKVRAQAAFDQVAGRATDEARSDPPSAQLVAQAQAAQIGLRGGGRSGRSALAARSEIVALADRQAQRRTDARARAGRDSRRALFAVLIAGGLALFAVLALVSALLARVRRPLDELVVAARKLACGDLRARVPNSGPDELRSLGGAFNAMADELARALGSLESERARLDLTIRSLGDALLVIDASGAVVAANPRAAELLPDLPAGARLADAPATLPALERALAGDVTIERGDRTLAATASRLMPEGEGASVVWTVRDVTERARLERLKSEFVATASHELRSPLTSIKGFVELLSQTKSLDGKQREFIEIILVSTNRLVDLVNELLDVARIEAGQAEIHTRATDLSEIVDDVVALIEPRLEASRQTLSLDVAPGLPRALADPARVRQILTNLVTNAHLYTDPGGEISIGLQSRGEHLALTVTDTGRGMTEEQIERVFERFYRGAHGGGAGISGTGLGLAIVRSLVDLHGGTIEISSHVGEGSTFTVCLPRAALPAEPSQHQAALRGKRVLVIDDEPEVARLIVSRLAPYGVDATVATSGPAGIELLRDRPFDALTLDILMPGMSGFEVLATLRADPSLAEMPVVVVSVFSGREALSGEWVVSKPIDADELAEALGGAVLAGRVRVLVLGREAVRPIVSRTLAELGIEHEWAPDAATAHALCERFRFEAALLDAGVADAATALAAITLRGQRLRPAILVFSVGADAPGIARLDATPLSVEEAGAAVIEMLVSAAELPR